MCRLHVIPYRTLAVFRLNGTRGLWFGTQWVFRGIQKFGQSGPPLSNASNVSGRFWIYEWPVPASTLGAVLAPFHVPGSLLRYRSGPLLIQS